MTDKMIIGSLSAVVTPAKFYINDNQVTFDEFTRDVKNVYQKYSLLKAEIKLLKEKLKEEETACKWKWKEYDDSLLFYGEWTTGCGWITSMGNFKYCPYCGKKIEVVK